MTRDYTGLLERLRRRTPELVADLGRLVQTESPSNDTVALRRCASVVADLGQPHFGEPEMIEGGGVVHVRWRIGKPSVMLLGHFDTVWPRGTIERWGFSVRDGRATGPGVFDMKAGIVQGLAAVAELADPGVEILFTADEEIGGASSRALIEEGARRSRAVLVLEPSADGALKIARKGGSIYRVRVTGRAAHAGLEPEKGINALIEASHQVLAIAGLGRADLGTTVTPSLMAAGTTSNTVPAAALVHVDSRAEDETEQRRVDDAMKALEPVLPGAAIEVEGGIDRPPLPRSASAELFEEARRVAAALGLETIEGAGVGGGSDGNFTAALGVPTLDGLGAVGGGAHAEGEWVAIDRIAERAALVAGLIKALAGRDVGPL